MGVAVDNARLFRNTQNALGETEGLYQASSELNSVQTYEDILDSLRRYTILGKSDRLISILLFNHPWFIKEEKRQTGRLPADSELNKPEWLEAYACWSQAPAEFTFTRIEVEKFPGWSLALQQGMRILEDVGADSSMEDEQRRYIVEKLQAQAVIWSPLYVGNLWIGLIFAAFGETITG